MPIEFSGDIVSLSDFMADPGKVVHQVGETHRSVLLASDGRGGAVVLSFDDYEAAKVARAFMRDVVVGLAEIDAGEGVSLDEAKAWLGLSQD